MDEIEAKFTIPDADTWHQLQEIDRLAGYALDAVRVETIRDTFLDTAGRVILSAGFYCRQREYEGQPGVWLTVKSLSKGTEGAVHHREELQLPLPNPAPPSEWPAGPLRERVLGWAGPSPLVVLFTLEQVRHARPVLREGQPVAELSLDEVRLAAGRRRDHFWELELELTAGGTDADLAALVAALPAGRQLPPQSRSKFERGLAFLEQDQEKLLTPDERAVCAELTRRSDLHGRRARALLALDAGLTQEEAGRQAGMSERRVRYWQAAFRQERLKIFPERILPVAPPEQENNRRTITASVLEPEAVEPERALDIEQAIDRPTVVPEPPSAPGQLDPDDTMAQAARKTLVRQVQRMLGNEEGVRLGADIEAVHDMRVATRRMRAAMRVFGDFLDAGQRATLVRELRRAGRALGAVRDMDVFRDKTQRYLDTLPEMERSGLDTFLAAWKAHYRQARENLLAYLDGERYARLQQLLTNFLQETGPAETLTAGVEPRPHRLRQVVPVALYQGLATVRAFDEWLAVPGVPLTRYHQLRIASKRLRYALEFFRDVLGSAAGLLVERVKALQDHLGDLQDAVVACGRLRDFLVWGTWDPPAKEADWPAVPILAPGVATYLAFRQAEIQRLLETFPAAWEPVRGPEFGQLLAQSVAVLL